MSSSMYSAVQRFGTFLSFFFSCLLTTLGIIALSNFVLYPNVQPENIDFKIRNIALYRGVEDPYMNKLVTLADLRFDLSADFTPLFHWNAKQIYLYIVLEYKTESHERNEVIIWDKIIQSPALTGYQKGGQFMTKNARNKYAITDVSDQLYGAEGVVSIRWNTVAHVGKLSDTSHGTYKTAFPLSLPSK